MLHTNDHKMEGKKSESITRMEGTDEQFVSETYMVYRDIYGIQRNIDS